MFLWMAASSWFALYALASVFNTKKWRETILRRKTGMPQRISYEDSTGRTRHYLDYSRDPDSQLPPILFDPPDDLSVVFWGLDSPTGRDVTRKMAKYVGPRYQRLRVHDLVAGGKPGILQLSSGNATAFVDGDGNVVAGDRRVLESIGWLTTFPPQTP